MSIGIPYAQQGLMDAYGAVPNLMLATALPYGGSRDVNGVGGGAKFLQGQAIGVISTTPANEQRTLTLAGASGTVTLIWTFSGNGVIQTTFSASATTAQVLAAVVAALPGWSGNLAVTGTPGSSYVFTFGGNLTNVAIGGGWQAAVTSGTATWATTQKGSAAVQYDAYSQALNNDIDGFLQFDVATDYTGAREGGGFGPAIGQPSSFSFFSEGFFNYTDLVQVGGAALDANALTLKKVFSKAGGTIIKLV